MNPTNPMPTNPVIPTEHALLETKERLLRNRLVRTLDALDARRRQLKAAEAKISHGLPLATTAIALLCGGALVTELVHMARARRHRSLADRVRLALGWSP